MKKLIIIVPAIVVLLGAYYGVNAIFNVDPRIPTFWVEPGELVISLDPNGSIDARRAVTLSTPRIRNLQVTWLAPEGSMVQAGEMVIKFDATRQSAELVETESELKIKRSALNRARQELTIQEKQLTLDLEKSRRSYDEKKHDAPRIAEEALMEKELAELNFEAKVEQLKADVEKAEVEVDRARSKLTVAQKEMSQTSIDAPIPGLVVYLEIWKGGTRSKVQEGDSPWPGQGLVNLPDLSEMIVKTAVSEVDASAVDSGQKVEIRLDAFPDKVYSGVITKKSTLARKKEPGSKINVFDVEVAILDSDERLKPGMSAACKIIVQIVPDVLTVPLESVFEKNGQTVVYMANEKERPVTIGLRNDMFIVIKEGLKAGDEICLLNPSLDEHGLPGDRAEEPELNRGRQSRSESKAGRRSGSRRKGR